MKNNRLPIYIIFVLVGIAIVYRMSNPPPPPIPGPIGGFPVWNSTAKMGQMASQSLNSAGTMWAGAWNYKPNTGTERSAIWMIDFNGYTAKSCVLPDGSADIGAIGWVDDNTVGVIRLNSDDKLVYIDAGTGKIKRTGSLDEKVTIDQVIYWPPKSDKIVALLGGSSKPTTLAVLSDKTGMVGKEVTFDLPKDGVVETGGAISPDGNSFVFSVADPAAKDGRSFYLADTKTGLAKKIFDLGAVPGRIEGIWLSPAGVLMVCKIKNKLECVVYDVASGKVSALPSGVGDLAKWPGAPKSIGFTTYYGGYKFDLATAKTKVIFNLSKKDSERDQEWRDMIRDNRLYPLKNGNSVTISESNNAIDIRELKKNGEWNRDLLKRF